MTGQRRLADERVPHARLQALLRRDVPAADQALGPPELPRRADRPVGGVAHAARRGGRAGRASCTQAITREAGADLRGETRRRPVLDRARDQLLSSFDREWGGFGAAPKFPRSGDIRLLLRDHLRTGSAEALHAATFTLQRMAQGGIYDQLGGGFHRYSTDERWLHPALREDAVRQRAALARVPRGVPRDLATANSRASHARPASGPCARC